MSDRPSRTNSGEIHSRRKPIRRQSPAGVVRPPFEDSRFDVGVDFYIRHSAAWKAGGRRLSVSRGGLDLSCQRAKAGELSPAFAPQEWIIEQWWSTAGAEGGTRTPDLTIMSRAL